MKLRTNVTRIAKKLKFGMRRVLSQEGNRRNTELTKQEYIKVWDMFLGRVTGFWTPTEMKNWKHTTFPLKISFATTDAKDN